MTVFFAPGSQTGVTSFQTKSVFSYFSMSNSWNKLVPDQKGSRKVHSACKHPSNSYTWDLRFAFTLQENPESLHFSDRQTHSLLNDSLTHELMQWTWTLLLRSKCMSQLNTNTDYHEIRSGRGFTVRSFTAFGTNVSEIIRKSCYLVVLLSSVLISHWLIDESIDQCRHKERLNTGFCKSFVGCYSSHLVPLSVQFLTSFIFQSDPEQHTHTHTWRSRSSTCVFWWSPTVCFRRWVFNVHISLRGLSN